jgi:hypothetical protein
VEGVLHIHPSWQHSPLKQAIWLRKEYNSISSAPVERIQFPTVMGTFRLLDFQPTQLAISESLLALGRKPERATRLRDID